MRAIADCRLYGIVDLGYVDAAAAPTVLRAMLEGGVQIVQLRAKTAPREAIARLAEALLPLTRGAGVPLILNDYPEMAGRLGVDGVHVGQDDLPVAEARRLAGAGALVGKSTHSLAQAEAAVGEAPDYIGFGPLFATPTKPDYQAIGTGDIRRVHERVALPVFCIGGIKEENLDAVLEAGARRVVIVSGILKAADIPAYCRAVLRKLAA